MNTKIAIVKNGFSLRGRRFRKYSIVSVWIVSERWHVQPYGLNCKIREALWYTLPDINRQNLEMVDEASARMIRSGIIGNSFKSPES